MTNCLAFVSLGIIHTEVTVDFAEMITVVPVWLHHATPNPPASAFDESFTIPVHEGLRPHQAEKRVSFLVRVTELVSRILDGMQPILRFDALFFSVITCLR